MEIREQNGITLISGLTHFSLPKTFGCGQSFRVFAHPGGFFEGVVGERFFRALPLAPSSLLLPCPRKETEEIWIPYLSLDLDYEALQATFPRDGTMQKALAAGDGIRILRQERWETLCTFILSQNNNIPRIEKMVRALSETYGKKIKIPSLPPDLAALSAFPAGGYAYAFPSAETLAKKSSAEALRALKFGFRAEYVMDAASRVASGEIDLSRIGRLPTEDGIEALCSVRGVGRKVAACALLFGFEKYDAFPIDVWVRRLLDAHYGERNFSARSPGGIRAYFGENAGIAQQYLFFAERLAAKERQGQRKKASAPGQETKPA